MINRMSSAPTRSMATAADPKIEFKGSGNSNPLAARARPKRQASSTLGTLENSVFQKINQYRQQKGLSVLKKTSVITQQARQHSLNMANSRTLSHDGFDKRVQTIGKTIRYRAAAENVAYNAGFSDPVAQAVNGWLKSPGHLQNIMGNYNLTGVGVAKNSQGQVYFTQIFIKS